MTEFKEKGSGKIIRFADNCTIHLDGEMIQGVIYFVGTDGEGTESHVMSTEDFDQTHELVNPE